MTLEELKVQLRSLIIEVNKDNFTQYYDKFDEVIITYRDAGGKGKLLSDFILELYKEFSDVDDWKDEIIFEASARITGYCSPSQHILFDDFDEKTGSWK